MPELAEHDAFALQIDEALRYAGLPTGESDVVVGLPQELSLVESGDSGDGD